MPIEVWTSPGGTHQVTKYIPEGYENETREEWAERLGLDLSVFQYEDPRTPEERAQQRAEAVAEMEAYRKAEGLLLTEEEQAELAALAEHLGLKAPTGETAPK